VNGIFQKNKHNPPVDDINTKFQGGRAKVFKIPGEYAKI